MFFFFFQAEDGIRDTAVTGVQTCALPIYSSVGYAVAACKMKFNIEYNYRHMANMMVEEGLLNSAGVPVKLTELVTNLTIAETTHGFNTDDSLYLSRHPQR